MRFVPIRSDDPLDMQSLHAHKSVQTILRIFRLVGSEGFAQGDSALQQQFPHS